MSADLGDELPAEQEQAEVDDHTAAPAVTARGLVLRGERGIVFGPLDLDIPRGSLAVLTGPEGSGRTCLLLTLVGRMAPSSGSATILGHRLPTGRRRLHRQSTLAHFAGIDDLDEGLTVHEVLAERAAILTPLWRRVQRTDDAGIAEICGPVFGHRPLPAADTQIWHLDALDVVLLQIALALMGSPELLVVDDVDALTDPVQQRHVWEGLERLARERGTTIVGVSTIADVVPDGALAIQLATGAPLAHHSPTHALPEDDWSE